MLKANFIYFSIYCTFWPLTGFWAGEKEGGGERGGERGEEEDCVTGVCESRNGGFNFYSVTRRWSELQDGVESKAG